MDPILSVIAVLCCGALGGVVSRALRLPHIICMILLGLALAPALHPSLVTTCSSTPGAVNPASSLRSFALLIALARGGLTMRLSNLSALRTPIALLGTLPFVCELLAEAIAAKLLLPDSSGIVSAAPPLTPFLAASIWAPLSPSIVIPNMLSFAERGLERTAGLVLTAAPFEIGVALLTIGSLESIMAGGGGGLSVLWVPVSLLGSLAFGFSSAYAYYLYIRHRTHKTAVRLLRPPEPWEATIVFYIIYSGAYALSGSPNIPKLVGFLTALSASIGVQYLLPSHAAALAAGLKPVWAFAECFLFVLTGVVVRSAVDGGTAALSGAFVVVLMIGSVARLSADVCVAVAWGRYAARARALQQHHMATVIADASLSGSSSGDARTAQQHMTTTEAVEADRTISSTSSSSTTLPQQPLHSANHYDSSSSGSSSSSDNVDGSVYGGSATQSVGAHSSSRSGSYTDVMKRTLLLWSVTLPKATLQASLGSSPASQAAALGISAAAGAFIAQSAAMSILYCATIGSLLTFTLGERIARDLEDRIEPLAGLGEPLVDSGADTLKEPLVDRHANLEDQPVEPLVGNGSLSIEESRFV